MDLSCLKIGDLFSTNSLASNPRLLFLNPEQRFFVMSIVNSIPPKWHSRIKYSTIHSVIDPIPEAPSIMIKENSIPILDVSSKQISQAVPGEKKDPAHC